MFILSFVEHFFCKHLNYNTGLCKIFFFANLQILLKILKVEHKSFPMIHHLSHLDTKHGIQRWVKLPPPSVSWFLSTLAGIELKKNIYFRRKSYLRASEKDVMTVCNNITLGKFFPTFFKFSNKHFTCFFSSGDWFILILISENIDAQIFSELVRNKLSLLLNYYS